MTEEEKMLNGEYYNALDASLQMKRDRAQELCMKYNNTTDAGERREILSDLLGESDGATLQGPIHFSYGKFSKFGPGSYANFNLTVLDHAGVTVGKNVMIGPNCTLVTANHPIHYDDRRSYIDESGNPRDLENASPIVIEDDSWLAANVTVCPGVTIGHGSVIAAGSVVLDDIPPESLAAGVPCHALRKITEEDRLDQTK